MLDSRQIAPSPLGVVPELPSDTTAQCRDELHPPPVELPAQHYSHSGAPQQPTVYTNVFDMAPAELPTHRSPVERTKKDAFEDQKVLRSPGMEYQKQHAPPSQQPEHPPYPQSRPHPERSQSMGMRTSSGQYQPYNPGRRVNAGGDDPNRGSRGSSQFALVEHQEQELVVGNKRHSIAGAIPAKIDLSDVPAALHPQDSPKATDRGTWAGPTQCCWDITRSICFETRSRPTGSSGTHSHGAAASSSGAGVAARPSVVCSLQSQRLCGPFGLWTEHLQSMLGKDVPRPRRRRSREQPSFRNKGLPGPIHFLPTCPRSLSWEVARRCLSTRKALPCYRRAFRLTISRPPATWLLNLLPARKL